MNLSTSSYEISDILYHHILKITWGERQLPHSTPHCSNLVFLYLKSLQMLRRIGIVFRKTGGRIYHEFRCCNYFLNIVFVHDIDSSSTADHAGTDKQVCTETL